MLKVNKNTEIFEAVSETPDGQIIMTFKAQVNKTNPADSISGKKSSILQSSNSLKWIRKQLTKSGMFYSLS